MKPRIPETVARRILLIRGQKVMLDADLVELYGVETRALNQAVKRNAERFPPDFMFRLTSAEKDEVVTNCDHLAKLKYSPNQPPCHLTIGDAANDWSARYRFPRRRGRGQENTVFRLTHHWVCTSR